MGKLSKPKNTKSTILQLLKYMTKYKLQLLIACICAVITPILSVRGTFLLKPAINDYIIPLIGMENPDLSAFVAVLLKMGMFYVLAACTLFIQTKLMTKICHETIFELRSDMFEHMQHLPVSYFDVNARGKIMSSYISDVNTLTIMLKQSVPQLINGAVSIVSIFISMMVLSVRLTMVVIIYVLVVIVVNRFLIGNSAKYTKATQESMREMNGLIEEMVDGQNEIKLFTREDEMRSQFRQESKHQFDVSVEAKTYTSALFSISEGLSNLGFALCAVIGVLLAIRGKSDVGTICAFIQYYKQFHIPVVQVSRQIANVMSALAGSERIFALLNEEYETNEGKEVLPPDYKLKEGIEIKDLVFGYKPEHMVLKNINLNVKAGQKVAFVGSSGAGKTTVANLINRFYDVTGGYISIDGINVNDIEKSSLRNLTSIVLQDTHLFTGTIRDNIRFGRLDASDSEVEDAAKLVNADFFIEHLPDKYETYLESDGAMLSDGQRQLLAVTRAAVSKAPILIMDEATSSVDTRTEQLIEQGLRALMKDKTVFMIAHRLSTVRTADIIVVLDHGSIVECGNHDELMKLKGRYYDLNTGSSELL